MRKLLCAAVAAGLLAGSAWAGDANRAANPGDGPLAGGVQGTWSYAKNDRILKYLGLTQEQADKIDALFKDKQAAVQELYKGLPRQNAAGANGSSRADPSAMKDLQDKAKALEEAFKTKVLDLLTADQKAKFEAAEKAYADLQKAMSEIYNQTKTLAPQERQKAVREAHQKALAELQEALTKVFGDAYKADLQKNPQGSSTAPGQGQANTR